MWRTLIAFSPSVAGAWAIYSSATRRCSPEALSAVTSLSSSAWRIASDVIAARYDAWLILASASFWSQAPSTSAGAISVTRPIR